MFEKLIKTWIGGFSAILLLVFLSACSGGEVMFSVPTPAGGVEVDPTFREFYDKKMGGAAGIGVAIKPAEEQDGYYQQYTEKALMRYDRMASTMQQFSLAPLGEKWQNRPISMGLPPQTGERVENAS